MKRKIYTLLFGMPLLFSNVSKAQNYYAKTIEKVGVTNSVSRVGKTAVAKNTIFNWGTLGSNTVDLDPSASTVTVSGASFVRRLTTSQQLLWAVGFGGTGTTVNSLKLDNDKSVYIGGEFSQAFDVDPGSGVITVTPSGSFPKTDAFIIKLDSNGLYKWHAIVGSINNDVCKDLAFDAVSNSIYATGSFSNTVDFDPSASTYTMTATNKDMFVLKLNATTGAFVSAFKNAGAGDQTGNTIVCDASGDVYVSGEYGNSPDMDPSASTYTLPTAGYLDGFVAKYNASGTFQWASSFGGPGYSTLPLKSILIPGGNLILAGNFSDLQINYNGSFAVFNNSTVGTNDIFYFSISPSTGTLTNAYKIGSTNEEMFGDLSIDQANNVYISGNSFGVCNTNPVGTNIVSFSSTYGGPFFTKMTGTSTFDYTRAFGGGISGTTINNLNITDYNEIIIGGYFGWTANLDPSPGVIQNYNAGNSNVNGFLINYASCTSTVVASPVVTNTLTAICDGGYYIMTASSAGGGINWYASSTSTTVLASGTSYNTNNPFTPAGVYSYYLTNNTGCGVSPQTVLNLTVSTIPTLTVATSNTLLCTGQQATITASGAMSYSLNNVSSPAVSVISPTTTTTYTIVGSNVGCPVTAVTITQSVSTCTGIEEATTNNLVSIYPNPANDFITVGVADANEGTTIHIINALGELVLTEKATSTSTTLKTENLTNGIYFVKVESKNGSAIKKFIKQ
jgi:hypothetical protein